MNKLFLMFLICFLVVFPVHSNECEINEYKYEDKVTLIDVGYGNLLVSAPAKLDSKSFQTVYISVADRAKKETRIQAELKSSLADGRYSAHVNICENRNLDISFTLYWESDGDPCPTIVIKRL